MGDCFNKSRLKGEKSYHHHYYRYVYICLSIPWTNSVHDFASWRASRGVRGNLGIFCARGGGGGGAWLFPS